MKKILLTGGCSFSAPYPEEWKKTWVQYVQEKYEFNNYIHTGIGASGNELITYRLLYYLNKLKELQKTQDIKIYLAVMWSQADRIDIMTNNFSLDMKTDNGNMINHESIETNVNLNNNSSIEKVKSFLKKNSGFIRPGGKPIDEDFYRKDNPNQREWLLNYYKDYYTDEYAINQTLKNISLIQNYCEKNDINYIMFSMENLFDNNRISINNYPNIKNFLSLVDWEKFVFYEEQNGLYEYTHLNNLKMWEDNFHPHSSTHKHFIDNFDKEIKKIWKIK